MSDSREADRIRREMERVRRNLDHHAGGFVDTGRKMLDWHHYVRAHPWLTTGAAAALGYLLVPQRTTVIRPDAETLERLAKKNRLVVKPQHGGESRGGLGGYLIKVLANAFVRTAVPYLAGEASRVFSQAAKEQRSQHETHPASPPE